MQAKYKNGHFIVTSKMVMHKGNWIEATIEITIKSSKYLKDISTYLYKVVQKEIVPGITPSAEKDWEYSEEELIKLEGKLN